ncbi:hypothetical protein DSO57_1002932 [Entomophthora muscae]|uniref:Uncharacterized protein n=1 Tax=Entomophthora muscae TaxID=34485 RepID=A0ACC2T8L8_9FUNG|nr:hypothetical protein DSO57_1002932 [Entomophthora muscae]
MKVFAGILLGCAVGGYELTVLHTNDVHSHYDESNRFGTDCTPQQGEEKQCYGGLARFKTAIDVQRSLHNNTLLLDGGDQFQGTMFYSYYRGNVTAEAMEMLGYDVMTLGNHEFDHGPENVARALANLTFPIVSSNMDASAYPSLASVVKPYTLFPEHKLAVVGYITATAPLIASLGKVVVEDPVKAVQRIIDEVNGLGYTRVIAVSHNGYTEDIALAKQVRGLALIVGGHSHSYLAPLTNPAKDLKSMGMYPTSVPDKDGKSTYIVQAYCWGRFLGHVDVKFGEDGYLASIQGAPIELDFSVEKNKAADARVRELRKPFDGYANQVIGETLADLDQSACQSRECTMGSFVCNAMLEYRPQADFSFINAGGVRASIPKGNITRGNVITVLPFSNTIVEFPLTGSRIWNLLEAVISKTNPYNYKPVTSFIQVSGLRFEFNVNLPPSLTRVQLLNRTTNAYSDLVLTKNYTAVTLDFLAAGGDNFLAPPIINPPLLDAADEVIIRYIKSHSPVNVSLTNRITISQSSNTTHTPTPNNAILTSPTPILFTLLALFF